MWTSVRTGIFVKKHRSLCASATIPFHQSFALVAAGDWRRVGEQHTPWQTQSEIAWADIIDARAEWVDGCVDGANCCHEVVW